MFIISKSFLYLSRDDKTTSRQESKISIANGLAWSSDGSKFFYIDTLKFRVDVYDYDQQNGDISNGRVFFDFKKNNIAGYPDGMTIDVRGHLWVNFSAIASLTHSILTVKQFFFIFTNLQVNFSNFKM